MARPLRIQFQGAWYHVMNRGTARQQVFFTDSHREHFLELLNELTMTFGIEVHAYCLMGNHYHLILHTPRGNLSEAMRHLNSRYTQHVNRSMRRDGPLFRGRYKAILVSAEEYLLRLSRYVHLNPLESNMVQKLQNYKWSSYPAYINATFTPDWLKTDEINRRFKKRKFSGSYQKFVETGKDEELEAFYNNTQFQPVLGGDNYCEAIFKHLGSQSLSGEIVGAENIIVPPDLEKIIAATAEYYRVETSAITQPIKKEKNDARRLSIYLCREVGGHSLNDIAKVMGDIAYSTVSNTIRRAKDEASLMRDAVVIKKRLEKNEKRMADLVIEADELSDEKT